MIINQEKYENIYLLTRKMFRFVDSLSKESKEGSDFYKYLKSNGYDLDDADNSFVNYIKIFIEEDILNCYFCLRYQKSYDHELYLLFNVILYGFIIGDVPWEYSSYLNFIDLNIDYFKKMFDDVKTISQSSFPNLYIKLSRVDKKKADEYISILQKIAIFLAKNKLGTKKQIDERIDVLLSNPQLFLSENDDNNENHQIEHYNDNKYVEDSVDDTINNNSQNMSLLKDKLINGVSFEITKEEYVGGNIFPFELHLRISNHNNHKKKIKFDIKYISVKYGLKTRGGIFGEFIPDNSFVDLNVGFEDITGACNGDRMELIVNDGKFATLRLLRERNQWTIVESIERSTYNRELKSKIEHFEAIEEQFGITLQNFSVKVEDENSMKLFCELLALNGEIPENDFTINIAIYDNSNEIVYTDSESKYAEEFKGFEVLTFNYIKLDITIDEISKIRIYPTR